MHNFRHKTSWSLRRSAGLGNEWLMYGWHILNEKDLLKNLKTQRNKDHAPECSAGWNIIAVLPVLIVGVGVTRTECASSFPPLDQAREPKHKKAGPLKAVWLTRGAHQPAPGEDPAQSCTQLPFWSTKKSDTAIIKSLSYLQELWMQLPAWLHRDAGAGGSFAVSLLNKIGWARGKPANISHYSRPR